jgi:hypothetical protein
MAILGDRVAAVAIRDARGKLGGSKAERKWQRLHVPALHQPLTAYCLRILAHHGHGRGRGFESPKLHYSIPGQVHLVWEANTGVDA